MRALILVAGDTIAPLREIRGGFPGWIERQTGDAWPGDWSSHDLRPEGPLPAVRDADAFYITGSSSSVTEQARWMLRAHQLVRDIVNAGAPLLGLCFGHQLIADALGGEVRRNPRGREIGTVRVKRIVADPLFDGLPDDFDVHATHVDSVTCLPVGASLLAETRLEPVAAYRVGRAVWGVQFHPEFDAEVMRGYLEARADLVREEGGDPEALLAAVREQTNGRDMLRNFATLARNKAYTGAQRVERR
jgi:GMP synthase (glutamine-hydrolysing)